MALTQLLEFTTDVLGRLYDRGTVQRGTDYARQRRAVVVADDPYISGRVRGSGGRVYGTEVEWVSNAYGIQLYDRCSCPLGGNCKHAVALIVTARDQLLAEVESSRRGQWRQLLAPVLSLADDRLASGQRPIALRFEINWHQPYAWETGAAPHALLTVAPSTVGKTGRWIKTGASWRAIAGHSDSSTALVAEHREAVAAMMRGCSHSLFQASDPADAGWFGPAFWPGLLNAERSGVQLIDVAGNTGRVVLEPELAAFGLDLSTADDGSVHVTATVTVAGEQVSLPSNVAGLIGRYGAFWRDERSILHLARLAKTLPRELTDLAQSEPVEIPAEEVPAFLQDAGPKLARIAPVSSDDTIAVIAPAPPTLVLQVSFDTAVSARLHWGFGYRGKPSLRSLQYRKGSDRDPFGERRLLTDLAIGQAPTLGGQLADPSGHPYDCTVTGNDVIALVDRVLPWLGDRGVTIELADDAPDIREATEAPLVTIRVDDDPEHHDWYDLGVDVSIEGEHIAFVSLFTALALGQSELLLPSGTWLRLDRPEFDHLHRLIEEARGLADIETDPGRLRVNRFQAEWWDEFAKLGIVEAQSERWSRAMDDMRSLAAPEQVPVPGDVDATLRHYQRDGLSWLAFLHAHRLGGILADDMGLGKTLQTLALFSHIRTVRPGARFLVVAPTSVVDNWRRETSRFTPDLTVATIASTRARRGGTVADVVGDAAVVVTSYTLLRLEIEQYEQLDWEVVVLDEAQFVKNHQSKTYQCVRRLDAVSKFAITGTPMENSLMDLWALLSITAPGLYPDPAKFEQVYRRPIESSHAPELLGTLRRRISPLMRRRTKEQVLTELPPKTEQVITVELNPRHRKIYDTRFQRERQKILGLVDDLDKNRFEVFRSLTLLRQLALDAGLVSDEYEGVGSAKLDQLVDQLGEAVAEGHRALVFSQFTRYLARVKDRLDAAGISYAYLDGRTRNRQKAIAEFKDGGAQVFLISLKAGGFGLNLTEADYCFVLDPWWNPAAETQAVDRAHRIGQANSVMVYRYVSAGTIEEKVMELKAHKQAVFDSVVGDDEGALSGSLTADDIRGLFDQ